jgi:pimeloyl-ACP methyl ester carboxylesterase
MDTKVLSIEANGVNLAYSEQGKGQPVIFVHGTPADYRAWSLHMEAFGKKYRAISYSRRCSYPNKYLGDYEEDTIANNAEDLAVLITRLGARPAHLIGHSYGAFIAIYCALKHPELVRTLLLAEPPAFTLIIEDPQNPLDLFLKSPSIAMALVELANRALIPAQEAIRRGDSKEAVRMFINGANGREGAFEQLPAPVRSLLIDNGESLEGEINSVMKTRFTREDAGRVTAPTLLAKGELSPKIMLQVIDILAEALPNREVVTFQSVSHAFPFEKLEEFNSRALEFLEKHR